MKTLLLSALFALPTATFAQICNYTIPVQVVSQGVGSYHITSDVTMPYNEGSTFYICSGVHMTIEGSGGSNYFLEDGAMLTILDQDGDNVVAKGNCTIVDQSTTTLVVTSESSTPVSKPNAPFNLVQLTCTNMTYDYQLVGGSAPCSLGLDDETIASFNVYPNPVSAQQSVQFDEKITAVVLTDLSGRIVLKNAQLHSNELSMNGMNPGVYLITVQNSEGVIFTRRLEITE